MKRVAILRTIGALLVLALIGWVMSHTRWEQVEVEDEAHGLAATDEYYALRHILEGAGATLEVRTTLDPLPPAGATLYLDSGLWDIFPERADRLKAWVEGGGHLVVPGRHARADDLRWIPLSFVKPHTRRAPDVPGSTPAPAPAASDADDKDDADDADAPAARKKPAAHGNQKALARLLDPQQPWRNCSDFTETGATTQPAFEPGRVYKGCTLTGALRPLNHVVPTWELTNSRGALAMRVPIGQGDVTGVAPMLVLDNRGLLHGDNGLIAVAVLQAAPGRAVWIVGDEAREPLLGWLWHEARTPLLLALAAIALALWRLMVRFGPREAVPPLARRSMGEQVRGTGQFIADTDAQALHAATRRAFEDVARTRVERWAERDDGDRIAALADAIAPAHALDPATLLASMNIGGGATPTQILTAIAVLEQARRALLRAPVAPPAN